MKNQIAVLALVLWAFCVFDAELSEAEGLSTREGEIRILDKAALEVIVPDVEPEERLRQIQEHIKENGFRWKAGLNSKARLSVEEKRTLLGSVLVPPEAGETQREMVAAGWPPPRFDWRDLNGVDWVTPVKDQALCGGCWAFSALGAMEASYNVQHFNPEIDLDLSEQHLISGGGFCCENCGDCRGGWMDRAFTYMRDYGVVDEACFPFRADDVPCGLCHEFESRKNYIQYFFRVVPDTRETYKRALVKYGPLSAGIASSDIFLYYESGVYEEGAPASVAGLNHAVVIVGWDDAEGAWIIKNSFGEDWGNEGYGMIAYGNIEEWNYVFAVVHNEYVVTDAQIENPVPEKCFVLQNHPNPFNPNTVIEFGLKSDGFVNLSIYNAAGKLVAELVNESRPAGQYATAWNGKAQNGSTAASGIYFCRLVAGDFVLTKKMVLLR